MSVKSKRATKESCIKAFGVIIITSLTLFSIAILQQKFSQLITKNLIYPSTWRWAHRSFFNF